MRARHQGLLLFAAGLSACSMPPLDAAGSRVAVVDKPPAGCQYVTTAYGRSFTHEYALNNLRNQVGSSGATHVVITDSSQLMQGPLPVGGNSLTLNGIAYRCAPSP